jgi:hypothetical protein
MFALSIWKRVIINPLLARGVALILSRIQSIETTLTVLANMAIIKGESGGRGHYARIKVAPLTLAKFLSTPQMELSDNEKIVLACMKRLKSSYRLHEAQRVGVAEPSYYAALATLKEKKLVKISSNGAAQITTEGKNALSGVKMPDKARFLL